MRTIVMEQLEFVCGGRMSRTDNVSPQCRIDMEQAGDLGAASAVFPVGIAGGLGTALAVGSRLRSPWLALGATAVGTVASALGGLALGKYGGAALQKWRGKSCRRGE